MKLKFTGLLATTVFCLMTNAQAQAQAQTQNQTQTQTQTQEQPQADAGKDALYVKSLAATCANCHGTNGVATPGSSVLSLAGLDKAYTIAQMKAFKTGTRPATVMHQLSRGYSDAQIEVLAAYFAAQKK